MKLSESAIARILTAARDAGVSLESWLTVDAASGAKDLLRNAQAPSSRSTALEPAQAAAIANAVHEPAEEGPDRLREHAEQVDAFDASHHDDPTASRVELRLGEPAPSGDGRRIDLGRLREQLDREYPGRTK